MVDWDSVVVGGLSIAGTGSTVAWGQGSEGTAQLALIESGAPLRVMSLPDEVCDQGAVRSVRWGYETPHGPSWDPAYGFLGVCGATGAWFSDWTGAVTSVVIPDDEAGRPATFLWPVSGDEDLRLLAAYGPDQELRVLGGASSPRLLPRTNSLRLVGDPDQLMVASHSGVVAVSGPLVVDGVPAQSCFAWAWSGLLDQPVEDEDDDEYVRYPRKWVVRRPEGPHVRLTDMRDGGGDVRFVGIADGRPLLWSIDDEPGESFDIVFPPGRWRHAMLPASTGDLYESVVLVGDEESVIVIADFDEPETRPPLPLPQGLVQSVALDEGFAGEPATRHAVVDGVLWVLEVPDVIP